MFIKAQVDLNLALGQLIKVRVLRHNGSILSVNPLPHDKTLDQTKSKAFVNDKFSVTKMIISVFDRVENIVGKGEIAPFPSKFSKGFFPRPVKRCHCVGMG